MKTFPVLLADGAELLARLNAGTHVPKGEGVILAHVDF